MKLFANTSYFVLISLALILFFIHTDATRCLRRGPKERGSSVVLHGDAVVQPVASSGSSSLQKIEWSAKILKDIVTWYDLQKDNVIIKSCSDKHIELEGNLLDSTDYEIGAVFVIDVDDWEAHCPAVSPKAGIPEEDDVLFFRIKKVKDLKEDSITLSVRRTSGRGVVPEVDLGTCESHDVGSTTATVGDVTIIGDGEGPVSRQTLSLPTSMRKQNVDKETTLTAGVSLKLNAGISTSITNFRLRRLRSIEFSWDQGIVAEASSVLTVAGKVESTRSGRLYQAPVPSFGFTTPRIPFIGRVTAGAYVRVDWTLELTAMTKFTASASIRKEIRRRVYARIRSFSFSTSPLPPTAPNRASASLSFGAEAGVNGFAGVRPALGVEVAFGRRNIGGNIGAKAGIELDTTIKTPPFRKVTSGLRFGVCSRCHALQGALNVQVKDLTLQMEQNQQVKREVTLASQLLRLRIGTICAIPRGC